MCKMHYVYCKNSAMCSLHSKLCIFVSDKMLQNTVCARIVFANYWSFMVRTEIAQNVLVNVGLKTRDAVYLTETL